jgi:hypothetical protein
MLTVSQIVNEVYDKLKSSTFSGNVCVYLV